jgi:hypothetical protein
MTEHCARLALARGSIPSPVCASSPEAAQCDANRSSPMPLKLATLVLLFAASAVPAAAQSGCAGAIAQFRAVIDNDVKVGHLNKSVHNRIVPDLGRVEATCRAGKDAEATRALATLKSRFGYR